MMTKADPYTHLEEAWKLDGNAFPAEAISTNDQDPYAEVYPDETRAFYGKLIRGGVADGRNVGFLWSQGIRSDTGYGKTRLLRHARVEINSDLGDQVLADCGMKAERRPRISAAYANLNNIGASGLYPVFYQALVDLALPQSGEQPSVIDRAHELLTTYLAAEKEIDAQDVETRDVAAALSNTHLDLSPGGAPLRPDLVQAFAEGSGALRRALAEVSEATRLRSGMAFLDFAITVLAAADIRHLFLFVDQLEDLATNKSITSAKRSREIGRIRDLLETEPFSTRLHMIFTFHNTAARVLERFWEQHRLPRFEVANDNMSAVVVLRGLTTDEQLSDVLKVYLAAKRSEAVEDELLPFEPDAVAVLRIKSEGRIGIALSQAHHLLQAGASEGVPVITGDFAARFFEGVVSRGDGQEEDATVTDIDDLLLE